MPDFLHESDPIEELPPTYCIFHGEKRRHFNNFPFNHLPGGSRFEDYRKIQRALTDLRHIVAGQDVVKDHIQSLGIQLSTEADVHAAIEYLEQALRDGYLMKGREILDESKRRDLEQDPAESEDIEVYFQEKIATHSSVFLEKNEAEIFDDVLQAIKAVDLTPEYVYERVQPLCGRGHEKMDAETWLQEMDKLFAEICAPIHDHLVTMGYTSLELC